MKIDLPEGGWASLRDPKKVPERLRRPIMSKVSAMGRGTEMKRLVEAKTPEEIVGELDLSFIETSSELNDLLVVALVDEWSYDGLPITVESVMDLPGDVYDALRTAVSPFITDIMPDFGPVPDPKAPTGS